MKQAFGAAGLVGVLAAASWWSADGAPLKLEPGSRAWASFVRGATVDGRVPERAMLLVPDVRRAAESRIVLEGEGVGALRGTLGVAVDGGPTQWVSLKEGAPLILPLRQRREPGVRIDFATAGAPVRLLGVVIRSTEVPWWPRAPLAFLAAAALTLAIAWGSRQRTSAEPVEGHLRWPVVAWGVGLFAGGALGVTSAPLWALIAPAAGGVRMVVPALLLLGSAASLALARPDERRRLTRGGAFVAAALFGAWVRLTMLPSTGSWDTEYWKAWMFQTLNQGLAGAYGPSEALPLDHVLAQATGQEPLWKTEWHERRFVIDYPPLAMAAWAWSWEALSALRKDLEGVEKENLAVKLPAVLGDVAGALVLLLALRPRRAEAASERSWRRAATLALLYWTLPISWLSSAVLGYLDAALAPMAAAALIHAGRGRGFSAGVWLALAALIKPTALIVAPAAVVALWAQQAFAVTGDAAVSRAGAGHRNALARAALGMAVVGSLVSLPYLIRGTFLTMVVHCFRILFQERLSGGYPNPWWLIGHALNVLRGADSIAGPVSYVHVSLLGFPVGALASLLFALAAFVILRAQVRETSGRADRAAAACEAGAALFLLYGFFAIGVHENHPHPLFLMLFATGLGTARLRWIAGLASLIYVFDMLSLSGLGRFHGPRYAFFEPLLRAVAGWRMELVGFDLTIALALLNVGLCSCVLLWLWSRAAPSDVLKEAGTGAA